MRYLSFNSNKSLKEERLIFDTHSFMKFIEYVNSFVLIFTPLALSSLLFLFQLKHENFILLVISILLVIVSVFIARFITLQFKKSFKFRKIIHANNRKENMDLIALICYWNDWEILKKDNYSHVIKVENSKFGSHLGRELFVVYHEKTVLLRSLTYIRNDQINPFHWVSQKRIENLIIEKIKRSTSTYNSN